jgi:RNA polymerase sigma factor (sigma-70 family)
MPGFKRLTHEVLDRRTSAEIVDYIRAASAAPDRSAVEAGFAVLLFREERRIRAQARLKLPRDEVEPMVQEIELALSAAILKGKPIEDFDRYLSGIIRFRIAEWHRSREGTPAFTELADQAGEDDRGRRHDAAEVDAEPGYQEIEDRDELAAGVPLLRRVLATLPEHHQLAIRLHVLHEGGVHSAQEAAEKVCAAGHDMSADNVAQIKTRFMRKLREELEAARHAQEAAA